MDRRREPLRTYLAAALLVLMTAAAYLPVLDAGFVWDDDDYLTESPGLGSVEGLWRSWFDPGYQTQYYPLVFTLFWVQHALWGLDPTGYHVVNVLLQACAAMLFWRLLLRLEVPGAWWGAAIFAVHPVMVESVAWVTELKNVLSQSLAFAAMLCYLRFAPPEVGRKGKALRGPRKFYAWTIVIFTLALFAKTVVVTMPAVLLVIYWWKRGRITTGDVVPLLPLFALSVAMGSMTAWVEKYYVGAAGSEWEITPVERFLIAGRALWFYAGKLAWPYPIIFHYPRWQVDGGVWWQYLYPIAALGVIAALWAARQRIGRGSLAAVLIFCGVLVPALGFFDVYYYRYSFVADHFQYHASVALIALAAAAGVQLTSRWPPRARQAAGVAAAAVLVTLGSLTYQQTRVYENLETLYNHIIAKNPSAWNAYLNLANHLDDVGRHDEALEVARRGVQAAPERPENRNSLGGKLLESVVRGGLSADALDEAIDHLREAVRLSPDFEDANFNLATALSLAGRHDEAVRYYARSLEIYGDDRAALEGLGRSLIILGRHDEAAGNFQRLLQLDPNSVAALHGLGLARLNQGDADAAVRHLEAALAIDPAKADVHYDLAGVLLRREETERARHHYAEALRLRPADVRAMNNLGVVHMILGETELAIRQFEQAVHLAPQYEEAQKNLERAREAELQAATESE